MSDVLMPFGKFRDYPLSEIPEPYLWWVMQDADQTDKHPGLAEAIEEELERRPER